MCIRDRGNVRVELSTEKGKAGELESNTDGMIDSLTIQKLVVETYGHFDNLITDNLIINISQTNSFVKR